MTQPSLWRPGPATIVPYSFQLECVDKVGKPALAGRLVADEMGLGKTVEGIWIDKELRCANGWPHKPTIIVASLAVHEHWGEHLVAAGWDTKYIAAVDRKNRDPIERLLRKWTKGLFTDKLFLIVHYEAIRLLHDEIGTVTFRKIPVFHVISDECQSLKNRRAQQTRVVKQLQAQFKTGLSGTPADDKPQDIWSILNWLYPRDFRSYWQFVNRYCEFKETRGKGGATFRQIVGVKEALLPELQARWAPFYIRREKSLVWKDMPEKVYTTIHVDLYPGQRRLYDQMRKDMIAWIGEHEDEPLVAGMAMVQLIRLQQFALATPEFNEDGKVTLVAPSSKLDALVEIVRDNESGQHVIFSQSRSMINLVAKRLAKEGVALYTGMVPQSKRDQNVRDFQNGKLRIFAGTIAAGGLGINLQCSSTIHLLDRHWSPSKNEQAIARVHRLGQKKSVQIFDYIARNTVDLGRNQVIASKWRTLKLLLGDAVEPTQYVEAVKAGE